MAKIDEHTEQRILKAANVVDVLRDRGVQLFRKGTSLLGLCPFHDDKHIGSFVVNERMNRYKCFSCGASGDAVTALRELEGMDYPTALRYLAAMYSIYIDDAPTPQVKKRVPRPALPQTRMMLWVQDVVKPYAEHYADNNLVRWMYSLPWNDNDRSTLTVMLQLYRVGTSLKGATEGWTVFPLIDMDLYVRDVKLMAYKPDGHRDKDSKYNFNWMSSMLEKAGRFNPNEFHTQKCLFGLHLAKAFTQAEVCIVESEKSALICSGFSNPEKKIWMATGGKSGLKPAMLQPLIDLKRIVILYPDFDAYDEWTERCKAIDSPYVRVSNLVKKLHKPCDGDKADIADIMVRLMYQPQETEVDKACSKLGIESHDGLADLIEKLSLKVE